jgi:ubiquitin-conjugating enzyme E2 variant
MTAAIAILLQSFLVLLAADFAAGFIHWAEDAYVREDTPLIGKVIGRPNVIHHHLPRHMTRKNWLQSSWDLCLIAAAIVLLAGALGVLTWHVWLFAAISANANQVHKWSHRTRRENGRIISLLQTFRLVQTPHHHAIHHTDPKNVHYCPVTNFLNPSLDRARFWDALEWLLARTIRLHRRLDTSLAGCGPGPEWIAQLRTAPHPSLQFARLQRGCRPPQGLRETCIFHRIGAL